MTKKPDYIAYSVAKAGEGSKDRWRAIGAAFINRDDSITVALDAVPVDGRLVLVPKQLIDKDQTWFWTEEWQAAEHEAENDLRAGQVKEFDTLDELIADLDADEAED